MPKFWRCAAAGPQARGATAVCDASSRAATPDARRRARMRLIAAGVARVVCCSRRSESERRRRGHRAAAGRRHRRVGGRVRGRGARAQCRVLFALRARPPLVRLKLAMSLDARTAPAGGGRDVDQRRGVARRRASVARAQLRDSHRRRHGAHRRSAARCALDLWPWVRQPLRVVLDPMLTCSARREIFHGEGAWCLPRPMRRCAIARVLRGRERVPRAAGGLDLQAVMRRLAELEVNELLVECGPRLAGRLRAKRVWWMNWFCTSRRRCSAPMRRRCCMSADWGRRARCRTFEIRDVRRIGEDLRLILIHGDTMKQAVNMFTGIIIATGPRRLPRRTRAATWSWASMPRALDVARMALGDSVSVQGACLTVTRKEGTCFLCRCIARNHGQDHAGQLCRPGSRVNLEPSLRAGDALGGHMVSGHVDAVGRLRTLVQDARSWRLEFELPAAADALRGAEGLDLHRRREPDGQQGRAAVASTSTSFRTPSRSPHSASSRSATASTSKST